MFCSLNCFLFSSESKTHENAATALWLKALAATIRMARLKFCAKLLIIPLIHKYFRTYFFICFLESFYLSFVGYALTVGAVHQ